MNFTFTLMVWLGALLGLGLSIWFYRRAKLSSRRHRLIVVLSIIGLLALIPVYVAGGAWLLGIPFMLLFFAYVFSINAWNWNVDQYVERWRQKELAKRPRMREQMERNAILRWVMKHRH